MRSRPLPTTFRPTRTKTLLTLIGILAFTPAFADRLTPPMPPDHAPGMAPSMSEQFEILDGNQDGFISPDEAAADPALAAAFVSLDHSGDGQLDLAEFSEFLMEPVLDTLETPRPDEAPPPPSP